MDNDMIDFIIQKLEREIFIINMDIGERDKTIEEIKQSIRELQTINSKQAKEVSILEECINKLQEMKT